MKQTKAVEERMRCTQCQGHMVKHFLDCMICLRCGNKELSSNDEKSN